jgi:hypothetical protein
MALADRFRHDILVHRWTVGAATDSRGARNDTYEPDAGTIRGWIQPRSGLARGEAAVLEGAPVAVSDALGFLPITAVVSDRDILEESGRLFDVVGPVRDAAGRGRHLELDLRQVFP